ncbi:MAG: glycerophosphodiester phosphodiesterase family protein, partial [Flavobacteriales bacterium]
MTVSTQVHGHRGCADAVPANTIPAFLRATATGCHWLEMDVVITGDDQVLVSHEPWMDHLICRDPEGRAISEVEGRAINIFQLPLAEVQRYGC